jgi:hypothetical protein
MNRKKFYLVLFLLSIFTAEIYSLPDMTKFNNSTILHQKDQTPDVGVFSILVPVDTVDSNSIVTPIAEVKNFGDITVSFPILFRDSTFSYNDIQIVMDLPPESTRLVQFRDWQVVLPRGVCIVKCSTALDNDVNNLNDFFEKQIICRVKDIKDFGVTEILAPLPVIPPVSQVNPKILVTNYGNIQATSKVSFMIKDTAAQIIYMNSTFITLDPQISDSVVFSTWSVDSGLYKAIAYTSLEGDINPSNDTMILNFIAGTPNHDVGVVSIISPLDTILKVPINPKVLIKNFGNAVETFNTYFQIKELVTLYYLDSFQVRDLRPNTTIEVTFSIWNPPAGHFSTECFTSLSGDMHPENDLLTGSVTVETLNIGWIARTSLPPGPSSKPKTVKSGGALAYVPPTTIYAFKGNNTNEFYSYDMASNFWTAKETIPWVGKKKRVKAGASLCSDNQNYVYALKGNGTVEFWRYSIQDNSWSTLAGVPVVVDKPKKIKAGAGLAFVTISDTQHFIYLLKGNGTFEFYSYWVEKDSWLSKTEAPRGPKGKKYKAGSCIAYDYHNQCIWTLKGGTNEFYAYDLRTGGWLEDKPGMPLIGNSTKKKKIKDGAGLAYSSATRSVYALKGGNTNELWHYVPGDSWHQMDDMTPGEKGVKAGGSLVFANGNLYALRGNKTNDFFVYNFGSGIGIEEPKINRPFSIFKGISMKVQPNPFSKSTQIFYSIAGNCSVKIPISIKLYNITGRMQKILVDDFGFPGTYKFNLNSAKLPKGIYFIRLTASNHQTSQKLVINSE